MSFTHYNESMSKEKLDPLVIKWLPIVTILISGLVAGVGWVSWFTRNVPSTSYVDDVFAKEIKYIDLKVSDSIKYTDDKINNVRTEAFAHSDLNRGALESQYQGLSAKLDMLIMMLNQQQKLTSVK